uniref:Uncharacterized protein n=1 Tax=Timema poppense TaxID=170557 RepID=A0A7R9DEW0_TIMPO|nr:unnamed protein product [Timema poppensis]
MRTQEDNVKRVRSTMQEKVTQLESQIQNKLTLAQTRRRNLEQEQLEKLREHFMTKTSLGSLGNQFIPAPPYLMASITKEIRNSTFRGWPEFPSGDPLEVSLSEAEHKRNNVVKLAEVRHIIEGMDSFKTEKTTKELQERLEIAELNREKELQKKLEKIQEKERRAEMVRQNKERLASQNEEQQTASSG